MQAHNIFSINRFGAYFKKHMVDNYRLYLMSITVFTGVLLFAMLFILLTETHINRYSELTPGYLMGLFIAGVLFTSKSFDELGNKPRGIDYLMLPASHLEKFLTTLVLTTLGFLVVYHVAFFLALKIGESVLRVRTGITMVNDIKTGEDKDIWAWSFYLWFIAQAVFLLGTLYFQKYSLIKTGLSIMIFMGGLYLVNVIFTQLFFHQYMSNWSHQIPFVGVNIQKPQHTPALYGSFADTVFLTMPTAVWKPLLSTAKVAVPLVLWTVAYFKLRDKEI